MPRRRRRNRPGPRGSSVRVTRTKGSGQSTSYSTGGISITNLRPTGRIAERRPTVRATVWDRSGNLSKRDIKFFFNGSEKSRFHYEGSSGALSYYVGNALPPGTHEVRIEVESSSSQNQAQIGGTARRRWTFTVARR